MGVCVYGGVRGYTIQRVVKYKEDICKRYRDICMYLRISSTYRLITYFLSFHTSPFLSYFSFSFVLLLSFYTPYTNPNTSRRGVLPQPILGQPSDLALEPQLQEQPPFRTREKRKLPQGKQHQHLGRLEQQHLRRVRALRLEPRADGKGEDPEQHRLDQEDQFLEQGAHAFVPGLLGKDLE